MPSLTISQLSYCNLALGSILAIGSLTLQSQAGIGGLTGLEVIGGLVAVLALGSLFGVKQIGDALTRSILLVTFLAAILASFLPRFGGFVETQSLFILANAIAFCWLVALFFTAPQKTI